MSNGRSGVEPVRILLVEDSETDVNLLREIMEESKLYNELDIVSDGVEAMKFLRREAPYKKAHRPHIILLDLNMPRMDGRETLERIRSDADLTDIPIVVLTSSAAEEDILKSYQLHANCYVTKPLDLDQFAKIVRAIEDFWFSVVRLPPKNGWTPPDAA